MRISFLAVIGLLFVSAANAQDEAAKKDLSRFQGSWELVADWRDGNKVSAEESRKTKITIKGEKFDFPDESGIGTSKNGTIKLDPSKSPKLMDTTANPANGEVSLGIYEFTEEGYKVCFAVPGQARPTEFSSKPGSGHNYQVWKRSDLDAIVGDFIMLSGEVKGEQLSVEIVKNAQVTNEGSKHTVKVGDETLVGIHRMDSSKSPKEIESTDTEGPLKGQKYLGIYKWENGVWTVCFAAQGKDRPKEFTTKSGTGEIMHIWKKK